MQVKCTAKLVSMKHFQSKPEKGSQDFYLLQLLQWSERQDENFVGYLPIEVFTDEAHYNALLSRFEPFMDVELTATFEGARVKYSL